MKNLLSSLDLLKSISTKTELKSSDIRNLQRIIAYIKKVSYEKILFSSEKVILNDSELNQFFYMFSRYKNNEPISKIIGEKSFWKHDFFVNKDVLDPRPETELIIESVLKRFDKNCELRFLDIGTGSGCILLSLLFEFKNSLGIGIDISEKAIQIADKNKQKLKIENAKFLNVNWNEILSVPIFSDAEQIIENTDVIVSNPPYIATSDIELLDKNVKEYDPHIALDGGNDGLEKYREISAVAKKILKKSKLKKEITEKKESSQQKSKNKYVFFEVGYNQAEKVKDILTENGFSNIVFEKDLSGINRVVVGESF